jgi:threonyl-tRNA synthetase
MIHRAPFGSMERFVAVLLEHCGGNFPLWLTTEQVAILPISEKHQEYAEKVLNVLKNSDIRAFIDDRNEKTGKKIRDNEIKKIPYMLVVGGNEEENDTVAVRKHGEGDLGVMPLEKFTELINEEIKRELNN